MLLSPIEDRREALLTSSAFSIQQQWMWKAACRCGKSLRESCHKGPSRVGPKGGMSGLVLPADPRWFFLHVTYRLSFSDISRM